MKNLSEHTPTQLLKMINDVKEKHDTLKQEIINYTLQVEEYEKIINNKLNELTEVEKNYVALIEEIEKRNAISQTDITEK